MLGGSFLFPPSLEAFKASLDVALGSLVYCLVTLHIEGGFETR